MIIEKEIEREFKKAHNFTLADDHYQALLCYERILQNQNAADKALELAYWGTGESLMHLRVYKQAEIYLKLARSLDSQNPQYHFLLGETYLKLEEFKEAESCFRKADKLRSDNPQILGALGWTYNMLQKNEKAEECFRRALALDDRNVRLLCDAAVFYMRKTDYRKAKGLIARASKIEPENEMVNEVASVSRYMENLHRNLKEHNT